MDEIRAEFLTESREGLDQLDADFVVLEESPHDTETLASVFRTVHTIKGTCGFLGFGNLERVAHVGENLLSRLRDGELTLTEELTNALLEMVDAVRALLDSIETTGVDSGDYSELVEKLELLNGLEADEVAPPSAPEPSPESDLAGEAGTASEAGHPATSTEAAVMEATPAEEPAGSGAAADGGQAEAGAPAHFDEEMIQVVKEFLEESNEGLDGVGEALIELEQDPGNRTIISGIFRTIHTIKGTCGFLGFEKLEEVTHHGESLLVKLRDAGLEMNADIASALLAMVDAVQKMLGEIHATYTDGNEHYPDLIETLKALAAGEAVPAQSVGTQAFAGGAAEERAPAEAAGKESSAAPASPPAPAPATPKAAAEGSTPAEAPRSTAEASIRVDVALLDSLMNQVGELVLARNQILQYASGSENPRLSAAANRLNLITSELQEGVMQTRMQPIQSVWTKLPRVVRDLSRGCGKKVRVVMEGKETELDKSLIEAVKDPITHLVRNSVDHGIEMPADRAAKGKPEEGVLLLRAFHEGGQVHIEIVDDGGGIDFSKVRDKALQKGLITQEQAARMGEQEMSKLIFLPGLSTAKQVTNISGRGVGMDVVKTNIEKIGGTVDLESSPETGTKFKIRLPLTLAIVPALIVTSGEERFAIPQVNLLELIRVDENKGAAAIEYIHGCPVYRLRGKLLPIVHLNRQLNLSDESAKSTNIVVLQADGARFGLVVDDINETQEIVVKPLAESIKDLMVYAGATIMGDGRVALILDIPGLAERSNVLGEVQEHLNAHEAKHTERTDHDGEAHLLVRSTGGGRLAIPLHTVARLEQFDQDRIENSGDGELVQYRGQIMSLIDVANFVPGAGMHFGDPEDEGADTRRVVVFGKDGQQVGLVVNEILDVTNEEIKVTGAAGRAGVAGTAVLQSQVTELFDVESFLQQVNPATEMWQ